MTMLNAMTIDVEDWYRLAHYKLLRSIVPVSPHVVAQTHLVLDLLAESQDHATFFVLGVVAEQFPDLVRRIDEAGHEIATHGYAHRRLGELGPEKFEADLRCSIRILEDIIQKPVGGHRAPEFSIDQSTPWAWEIMAAAGLRYDSSVFPIRHPRYGLRSAPRNPYRVDTPSGALVEFPLATARFLGQNLPIAGGGYLRVLPFTFIQRGVRTLNRQGFHAVMYVHPYEFAEEWLDLPVPTRSVRRWLGLRLRAIKRNWGRGQPMRVKFRALLQSFSFVPLREVMAYGAERQDSGLFPTARPTVRPSVSTGDSLL